MKLLEVDTVQQVREKMKMYFKDIAVGYEEIDIKHGLGRVVYENIHSQIQVPDFNRSTVDGYAVTAADTYGAGESMPVFLNIIGKVDMGKATDLRVSSGSCVYVPTGGMIPQGADAMLMLEYAELLDEGLLTAQSPVAPGENIIFAGDDISLGEKVLQKGKVINSRDIGVLCAAGISRVKVTCKPRVIIISTGDELVDPFGAVAPGKVRDINTYTLSAMVKELGGEVTGSIVVKDDYDLIRKAVEDASQGNHLVVISGGSSVGAKDNTEKVIDSFGQPGVFVHGVAVKPGKPTIMGRVGDAAVFGLPGHPISAVIIFRLFVQEFIDELLGKTRESISINAICGINLHSSPGKETHQLVELKEEDGILLAIPIHAKSAAVSQLSRARGIIRIPMEKEGIRKGETVKVELLE